jgi:hypothetical protein
MKKRCKNCGYEYSEGTKFCTNCGIKIEDVKKTPDYEIEQTMKQKPKIPIKIKFLDKILGPLIIIAFFLSIVAIILALVISQPSLTTGSVGLEELANNAVTSSKIVDGTITDSDISNNGISRIALQSISEDNIINNAIKLIHLSPEVNNAITCAAEVSNNSITSSHIKDFSISTIDIKNNSITAEKIPTDEIGSSEIAADAVGASEIAAESVDTVDIADNAITYEKMNIKMWFGTEEDAVNGTEISHSLNGVPDTVIVTPIYNEDNYIIHANVYDIDDDSFRVGLWKEKIKPSVHNISAVTTPGVDIYWITIR